MMHVSDEYLNIPIAIIPVVITIIYNTVTVTH